MKLKSVKQPVIKPKTVQDINSWLTKRHELSRHFAYINIKQTQRYGARRHLHQSEKIGRIFHLLSDLEIRVFRYFESLSNVVDIKEQVPLLPLEETILIAHQQNLLHPRNWKEQSAVVMTTDLVVTYADEHSRSLSETAYNIKYADQLYAEIEGTRHKVNQRSWEKIHIENMYHQNKGRKFRIITDQDVTENMEFNLKWFHTEQNKTIEKYLISAFIDCFIDFWMNSKISHVAELLDQCCKKLAIPFSTAVTLFKYTAYHAILKVDISDRITLSTPVRIANL